MKMSEPDVSVEELEIQNGPPVPIVLGNREENGIEIASPLIPWYQFDRLYI